MYELIIAANLSKQKPQYEKDQTAKWLEVEKFIF